MFYCTVVYLGAYPRLEHIEGIILLYLFDIIYNNAFWIATDTSSIFATDTSIAVLQDNGSPVYPSVFRALSGGTACWRWVRGYIHGYKYIQFFYINKRNSYTQKANLFVERIKNLYIKFDSI